MPIARPSPAPPGLPSRSRRRIRTRPSRSFLWPIRAPRSAKGCSARCEALVTQECCSPPRSASSKTSSAAGRINVLTLSVGGNDIGFTDQVESLIENTATGNPSPSAIDASVNSDLKALPGLYARLNKAIKGLHAARVLVTDYPNQFLNQDGVVSSIPGPFGTTLISTSDAQFATQAITIPLNNAIAAAATKFNWTFVDLLPSFSTHGYPSTDTWIRQLDQSLDMEGNVDGLFHPNAMGQAAIAQLLLAAD